MTATSGRLDAATPPPPASRTRLILRHLAAIVFALLVAVFVLPDLLFGLDGRSPFVQLVSFRPWVLVGVLGLVLLLVLLLRRRRRLRPFVAGTGVVLLIGVAMVAPRTIAQPVPTGGTPLTVLAFNTYVGAADVDALAQLISTEKPDLIAVVEAGEKFRSKLAPLIEPLGYRLHSSTAPGRSDVEGVIAVVATGLGDVDVRIGDDTSTFDYVEVTGGTLGALHFVAFHSVAPVPGAVPKWHTDMALLQRWCAGSTQAVVAGDFNATLDHSAFRAGSKGCGDAASQRGAGLTPTWGPTPRTRLIGPQIDHVLATDGIAAETFDVFDIPGSDHRAIVSTLRIP